MNMKADGPIGIISAMDIEAALLIAEMDDKTVDRVTGIDFYRGKLRGQDCVAAVCGIGKVFAALCAQTMILQYHPRCIINSGIGGALARDLGIGDIVMASRLVQHDMDTSPIGDPIGMLSGINLVYLPADDTISAKMMDCAAQEVPGVHCRLGTVASGDQFIDSKDKKARIVSLFDADVCEMEGAAIAQACYVNEVPFACMRAISDGGDEDSPMDYPTFAKMSADRAARVLLRFFDEQ